MSHHLCSKPDVLLGWTWTPSSEREEVREEERDDLRFPGGTPGSTGA